MALFNLARMTTATTGNVATITLGTNVSGFLTFAQAGVADGATVSYGIIDGVNSETGTGVYTAVGTTLTRNVTKSTAADARISLSGSAQVSITARAEDIQSYLPLIGGTLTGNLTISASNPYINFNKSASGGNIAIQAQTNGVNRWGLWFGDSTAESGSNAGSNVTLYRYSDAGASIDTPITINRATGVVAFANGPTGPTAAAGTNTTQLATTAFALANTFPAGTFTLFQQTNAPTGWTKYTGFNDRALRVVSGTASSGGTLAFSTVFGKTATDAFTLAAGSMPSHAHSLTANAAGTIVSGYYVVLGSSYQIAVTETAATTSAGSSGSHAHGMDIRVQYVDVIIASKN